MKQAPSLIVGITGSSGIIYGIRLLEALKDTNIQTHLVISKAAQLTLSYESDCSLSDLKGLADVSHPYHDIAASIASGSFLTMGMVIAPCSMNTLGEVANGLSPNLISRAADVVLKERRRLVVIPRETPLSLIHLENMKKVTLAGGIVCPPVPAFYHRPQSIDEMVNETVGRVLDLFDIQHQLGKRWPAEAS